MAIPVVSVAHADSATVQGRLVTNALRRLKPFTLHHLKNAPHPWPTQLIGVLVCPYGMFEPYHVCNMPEDTQLQLEILAEAKRMGLDPSNLSSMEYRILAMRVRTLGTLVRDGAKALGATLRTTLGYKVALPIIQQNEATCRKCPYSRVLADQALACSQCSCSGALLATKWEDIKGHCPIGLWDNRKVLTQVSAEQLAQVTQTVSNTPDGDFRR